VFSWLEQQCLLDAKPNPWLRLGTRAGRRVVQVTSWVGVVTAPNGFQIEILPKVGKAMQHDTAGARRLLIDMLVCLAEFRHIKIGRACVAAAQMPLLQVFIEEFLQSVKAIVQRGMRSDYVSHEANLLALRGKLLVAQQVRQNIVRRDRFFTAHDEFSVDRPENRLLHSALRRVFNSATTPSNHRLARELTFAFADVPLSTQYELDFQRVRLDRSMGYYADAVAWARLILNNMSPVTGVGKHEAPSFLYPMEQMFEAFVAKHLATKLAGSLQLKTQARKHHLVRHQGEDWFEMRPDLLVHEHERNVLVLDTKWKLLDATPGSAKNKYQLAQSDLYQMQAYGNAYLSGQGDVVLIYPKTEDFTQPLQVFEFSGSKELRLWVLPFCLENRVLLTPAKSQLDQWLSQAVA
jgi:5-methylcytosine-specific restriction enzyme subunit McrC